MSTPETYRSCPLPQEGEAWALFLDLDGTLSPLKEKPADVVLETRLLDLLQQLHRRLDGALAIISGRSINDLSRLLSPLELPLAGQHGAERHDEVNGYSLSEPDYATLHEAREELRRFLGAHPELELEDKGASLALHYRNAPDKQPTIERQLDSLRERLGDALIMHVGKSVFELRTTSCNKGEAIHHFMQAAPFAQRTPVFLGDDLTDEDGFEAVNALGGYSIKVGQGETRARYRLDDTHAVEAWLKTCLEQWPSR
ncbi:trehalose-phosphatase [Modicisalibacter xianhensis]|uniref:Trehalose 6-phosphate phosphatase n=1 Tax=Modicisalibacter xianhensis TaxID=442341 RepID=A0A1I3DK38_9GAMM|nr:trehalose-phosphatase [Halomonas xianhensis]SFH86871.1 trehalose 6-phosphate phosphatase [Halomonas xianhensis]